MRRLFFALLSTVQLVLAQTTPEAVPKPSDSAWQAFYAKQAEIRKRGAAVLQLERNRRKADLCAKPSNGNLGMFKCLSAEVKTTEANYLTYVRSIGALLRLTPPDEPRSGTRAGVERLPFDAAEAAWQSYRDQGCVAMSKQWQGTQESVANVNCRLDITWNHMDELANLYADLWH